MEILNIELPKEIKNLVHDIQEHTKGYKVFVGGGFIRDTYTGKQPKDLDIFFVPHEEGCDDELYIPKQFYVNYRKDSESVAASSDMKERGVSRLVGLFNSKITPSEVQYIVYASPMATKELVHDMDMNICRVMWSAEEDTIYASDSFIDGHQHKYIECLIDYDKIRTYSRYKRMEDKFPDYEVVGKPTLPEIGQELLDSSELDNVEDDTVTEYIKSKVTRHAGSLDEGE